MAGAKRKNPKKTVKPGKDLISSMVEDFRGKLLKVINQDIKELIIDMKGVNNIDSSGLGVLIAAKNSLDQAGGKLLLANVPENIKSLMQMIGLDRYFSMESA